MKNSYHIRSSKPVNLYTLKGEYICTLESISDTAALLDCTEPCVTQQLNGGVIKGYQIREFDGKITDIAPSSKLYERHIVFYEVKDKCNNLIASFDNLEDISSFYGVNVAAVNRAVKFKTYLLHKYRVVKAMKKITNNKNEFKEFLIDID